MTHLALKYIPCFSGCLQPVAMQLQHVIKLKLSSQLIGQFGHVTASASCKQPEKHGTTIITITVCGDVTTAF